MPPSYLTFHALFLAPPVAVLALLVVVRAPEGWAVSRELGLPMLVVLALAYTTPWDNYLIARGVWWYGDGTVAARAWLAPAGPDRASPAAPAVVARAGPGSTRRGRPAKRH